jgi:hypothetical protein
VSARQALGPDYTPEYHTAKALQSAKHISQLVKHPSSLDHHSPFTTCCVVMASVVHLSLWSFLIPDGQDSDIKEILKLDIGVLKCLGELWPVATTALSQVRGVAQEMLTSQRALAIHFWNSVQGNEIMNKIMAEAEGIDPLASTGQEMLHYPNLPDFSKIQ